MQSVVRSLLRLRLALSRFGTGTLLAGALLAAAALLWLGVLPGMSARVDDETRAVAHLRVLPVPKPVVPAPVLAAGRLADFYTGLGDSAHTGEIVMRLFDAATAVGVTLDKAEYKPGHDAAGRFDTYTIVLPVKGDYARLRQFSEKVLVTVPYAALDDMRFKRNSASDPGVEVNLRFTAFLRPVTIAPVSASVSASAVAAAAAANAASVAAAAAAANNAASGASAPATVAPVASGAVAVMSGASASVASLGVPLPTTDAMTAPAPARAAAEKQKSALPSTTAPAAASASAPALPATGPGASAAASATPATRAESSVELPVQSPVESSAESPMPAASKGATR
jgi:hypothetical protein